MVAEILESAACGIRDWWAFAGDPIFSGTVFMVGYAVAAWLMLRAARRMDDRRERQFWRLCGWLFIFQVANTHLDLHGLIYMVGRCLAKAQGWHEDRREVLMWLLLGLAVTAFMVVLSVLVLFGRNILGNFVLTAGVVIALGFTLVKGINFHGFEKFYSGSVGPFRGADLIELSGVALALLAALLRIRRRRG